MFHKKNTGVIRLRRSIFIASAVVIGAIWGGTAFAADGALPGMQILGAAKAPIGYVGFCREHAADCRHNAKAPVRVVLTGASFDALIQVDRDVNHRVKPATDEEVYGVEEKWEYPVDRGDCEDYALLKRRDLIEAGWPRSALLITVVRDENGDGHAVLTLVTDRGDFILDNRTDDVLPWQSTRYQYVKRQSQYDQQAWVYLGGGRDVGVGVATAR
jgi:predicted transglutaminase-like cysteine proteinase